MTDFSLSIVYADEDIALIEKPAGLLSCPGKGPDKQDSVQTRIPRFYPHAHGSILAHRLDQATSGLMVVGLHPKAHRHLQQQFENRAIEKEYEAILDGVVEADQGQIELAFRVDIDRRPHQVYDPVAGKLGITRYRVMDRDTQSQRTRIRFLPKTGRTHQLRVHAAHPLGLGCPIAGDSLYGNPKSAPRLLLHAARLCFTHPVTQERMDFSTPIPF